MDDYTKRCPSCSKAVGISVKVCSCGEILDYQLLQSRNKKTKKNIFIILLIGSGLLYGLFATMTPPSVKRAKIESTFDGSFSPFDGSHTQFVKLIKRNMHDPSSFDHVDTSYIENNGSYLVTMIYRGKNGFGALVINKAIAKVLSNGKISNIVYSGK